MHVDMHVCTYMHTYHVDDAQQGTDHVRKQDEHIGNASVCTSLLVTHAA